jgi:hypothetical protein
MSKLRPGIIGISITLLISGCAGEQQAKDTGTLTADILQSQGKAADVYGQGQAVFINTARQAVIENSNISNRFQADTDIAVDGLDVSGKGDATDTFNKHTRIKAADILADPLLAADVDPWAPPKGDTSLAAAVKALKPIVTGPSAIDRAYFFLSLAKAAQDAQKAAQP